MLSFGIEASRAFWTASCSAGLPSSSPPPSRAAVVMARASFVKSLPRRESTTAFLCLIEAHFEWPDMGSIVEGVRRCAWDPDRMTDPVRILLISGSLRSGSTNSALLRTAHELAPAGVLTTVYEGLGDLPHFNPDDDDDGEPLAPAPADLRARLDAADAVLFSTPEYAGALPGSFKNLLDWTVGGGTHDTPVAWVNASGSPTGAAHAHASLRTVLTYTQTDIVDDACRHIPVARRRIGSDGLIADAEIRARLEAVLAALAQHVRGRRAAEEASATTLPPVSVPDEIFKAYDIRGLHGEQIDGDVAEAVGRAFAQVLSDLGGKPTSELRIGLGRDMRLSAPELAGRYRAGMVAEGATVVDAGMVGSEMLYWLVGSRDLDGGLMCTASHNPKAYTGAKLVREGAIALSGDAGIQDVRRRIADGLGEQSDPPARGSVEEVDIYEEFQADALQFIDPGAVKPLRVVVDGGNGMAGPMVGPLLERLGLDLVTAYWEPDGEFPDHEPNPLLEENRRFIVDTVRSEGADLGIAWDGDADRCFFIDDTGRFVDGDFLTALLAESILRKEPGAAILYDVRASRAVRDTVEAAGGTACINRVGHAFFKTRMRELGAAFGGEVSGHYYFQDFYCADSGTIPTLVILELLSVEGRKLSELLEPLRSRYFISGEINSEVEDQDAKMKELEERYWDARISSLDGISIDYDDWHFNVRPSNTEPLLRLNLESLVSREHMEERRDEVLDLIRA